MRKIDLIDILFWLLIFIPNQQVFGAIGNRFLFPLGEKEIFLANTGTAMTGSAGAAFYNPAALSSLENTRISLNATTYSYNQTELNGFAYFDGTSLDLSSSNFNAIPSSTISSFEAFGFQHALSLLAPDSVQLSDSSQWNTSHSALSIFYGTDYSELWFGYSLAKNLDSLTPNLSLGFSLYLVKVAGHETVASLLDLNQSTNTSAFSISNQKFNIFGLTSSLGLLYEPTAPLSLGLKISTPLLQIYDNASFHSRSQSYLSGIKTSESKDNTEAEAKYDLPWLISSGFTLKPDSSWTFSADVRVEFAYSFTPNSLASTVKSQTVPRLNTGIEYNLSPTWTLLSGFFYSPSALPELLDTDVGSSREDYFGTTLGFLHTAGRVRFGGGGFFYWSDGSLIAISNSVKRSDFSSQTFGLLLSTSYSL